MKSVYVAGKYSAPDREGEDRNIARAAEVAAGYIRDNYAVFCPHTHSMQISRDHDMPDWEVWLRLDLYWLAKCDIIHMVNGWQDSKGARLEYLVAQALGLEIRGEI